MSATELKADKTPTPSELFYAGAIDRIKRSVLILGLLLTPICWPLYGVRPAIGFLMGTGLSYLNFHLLAKAVHGLADRVVQQGSGEKGEIIIARFLLRYLAIGAVVYVTFVSSFGAFKGLLVGLCLPVAGMMIEAAWELYSALRRGF
ncbi:MAG TPA: ATP synthase subunit I [Terriglobales bacterium]|nr:ATP synthase subunit I [Terriglobales bacterium]